MTTIRRAGFTDSYNLYHCNKTVLPIYYSIDEYLYFCLISPCKEILIAELDGKMVGYILAEYDESFLHVLSFGVYPEYRKMGIGGALINELVKIAKTNGKIIGISLFVHVGNENGIIFYEKYGFKKVQTLTNYYQGSLIDVLSQDAYRLEYMIK